MVYFIPGNLGFIPESWKSDGTYSDKEWPDDAVLLSDSEALEFWKQNPPNGKTLGAVNGRPAWVDLPEPNYDELIEIAEQQRTRLIDDAMQSIAVIQLKLHAGRKLTGEETLRLNQALDYINEVEAADTSTAPDVSWPERLA
ncbi:tail fiber assembly protein [Citrobacter sp. RHB35-C21]|uniref:tail fiber assembly protein n=1 Tax=Citrobacter sp. RHB35-C21 TaxID=2742626 RepID=UPI0015E9F353|nr:tail fiber assembly protein [Citrobacter sp. RHB35-C21]QMD53369.1 tail fiber assembly protein [Citrobacter sp. RHB35-C21]